LTNTENQSDNTATRWHDTAHQGDMIYRVTIFRKSGWQEYHHA